LVLHMKLMRAPLYSIQPLHLLFPLKQPLLSGLLDGKLRKV
jgi:hypothetical protein